MTSATLPVAVIGAGPVGLAAAAHLIATGQTPLILEAGEAVAASVREWRHVRFFSPWRYSIDRMARSLLDAQGCWTAPAPDDYPTGQDLVDRYLAPLAATPEIAPHLRLQSRVVSVTRHGFGKMKTVGREDAPFLLHIHGADGRRTLSWRGPSSTRRVPGPCRTRWGPVVCLHLAKQRCTITFTMASPTC